MARILAMIFGMLLGAMAGVAFGLVLGLMLAPKAAPGRNLEHEWYIMAIFGYMFWSVIFGLIVGFITASLPTPTTIGCTLAGLLIELLVGFVVWDRGRIFGAEHRSYTGFTIIWLTFGMGSVGGITGGALSLVRHAPHSPALRGRATIFILVCVTAAGLWALALTWFFRLWSLD